MVTTSSLLLMRRSPAASVGIFRCLIINHEQVDIDKAVSAGNSSNNAIPTAVHSSSSLRSNNNDNSDGNGNDKVVTSSSRYNDDVTATEREDARLAAQDILLSLPGVNVHNFRAVMNCCTNVSELLNSTEEEMCGLLGSVNGKKLFAFANQYH